MWDRLTLVILEDVIIGQVLRDLFSVVGKYKSCVDVDFDTVISVDVLDIESVVIDNGFAMEFIVIESIFDVVLVVVYDMMDRLSLDISECIFCGDVLREVFSAVELLKSWIDINIDLVVSVVILGNESVVVEYSFIVDFIV